MDLGNSPFIVGADIDRLSVYFYTGLVGIAEKAKRAVQEKIKKRTALDERDTGRINVASLSMAFEASLNAVVFTGAAILD